MYTLPASARQYVLFQRTELLPRKTPERRAQEREMGFENYVRHCAETQGEDIDRRYFEKMSQKAATIAPHIPKGTKSIVDIGCGIAALDMFLYQAADKPELFLVDKTDINDEVFYMFEDKGAFYNSLDLARETLTTNGVPDAKIHTIDAPSDGVLPLNDGSADLVISTISWGFHYPVSTYVDSVAQVLSDSGALILDVRKNRGGEEELERHFDIEIIQAGKKMHTLKCTHK